MKHLLNPLTVLAATLASAQLASADTLNPAFDAVGRLTTVTPIDKGYTGNLAVGPISGTDYFRSYLTFDLSGATTAAGDTTLSFSGSGFGAGENENNTSSVAQVFTLFSLSADWDGTTQPGPTGTTLATVNFTPATGDDTQALTFSSAALTTAFNAALGGNLYLGIMSDAEGTDARCFKWFGSTEDTGFEPELTYTPNDAVPPVIVPPTSPADDDTGVPVSTNLVATFSESIALENGGTITIDNLDGGPDTVITLPDTRVSVSGSDLVITPASPLANSTDYAVLISSDAVKDFAFAPNFFAGISDPTVWNFSTEPPDPTDPTLVTLSPVDGGLIPATASLVATFDEEIMATGSLLSEDFEAGNGGFTVETTVGSDWAHGTPDSANAFVTIDSGNGAASDEGQCWGTNLGDLAGTGNEGFYTTPTETCLRSAPIDLTGVTSAQLTFAQAFDLVVSDDVAVVNIIDDTTDLVIADAIYTVPTLPTGSSGWTTSPVIDLSAGVGQVVRIEWCLTGTGGDTDDFLGWYIDDVTVTGSNAGGITLKNLTKETETFYPVNDPAVTVSGDTLTITPGAALEAGDSYAVRIAGDALTDLSGNSFAGILNDDVWNFSVLGTIVSAFDDRCETNPPYDILDKTRTTDLAVGPVSSGRYFRSYLTFDLSGASTATGETTLVLSPAGVENNTSSVAQTFTLFVLDADWNGIAQPGPEGTTVATVNFTPATGFNDNRGISFTSAALTAAFNNALGGNLHVGIKSDVEGDDVRSFLFLASMEDAGLEPRLNYTVASGGDTFANWIAGKSGVGGQTALGDDPDGDGNDNGVENFFGTEPGVFSTGLVTDIVDTGAGTFTFTHPQGALASDLTAGYRWSTDLVTFHGDGASSGGTTVTFSTVPDPVEVGTPTTVTATVSGTPVQKLFVRVEVTQNP